VVREEGVIWFDGIELISDHGGHDVKESVDGPALLGQIQGGEPFDIADDGFSYIAAMQQHFVNHREGQGFHVFTHAGKEGQATMQQFLSQFFADIALIAEQFADEIFGQGRYGSGIGNVARCQLESGYLIEIVKHQMKLKAKNQPIEVLLRAANPAKVLWRPIRRLWHTGRAVESM
jgi:hypothetical protein